jgi:G3E family GTPase
VLGALRGPDLLRVKGLVHVVGRDRPVVYHRVHHLAHKPTELAAWPDGKPATQLVFITRNLAAADIDSVLQSIARL